MISQAAWDAAAGRQALPFDPRAHAARACRYLALEAQDALRELGDFPSDPVVARYARARLIRALGEMQFYLGGAGQAAHRRAAFRLEGVRAEERDALVPTGLVANLLAARAIRLEQAALPLWCLVPRGAGSRFGAPAQGRPDDVFAKYGDLAEGASVLLGGQVVARTPVSFADALALVEARLSGSAAYRAILAALPPRPTVLSQ